jgi:ketosteroid isomerase-like protein
MSTNQLAAGQGPHPGDQRVAGDEAAGRLIRYLHEGAFDTRPELKKAATEADFVGTHVGGLAGLTTTGRAVRVPYLVIHDLRDHQITALHIYFPMSLLMEQLTN